MDITNGTNDKRLCHLYNVLFSIVETPAVLNDLWLVGDNFTATYVRNYFRRNKDYDFFIKNNFEVKIFCASRFESANTNILSRIHSSVVNSGLNKNAKLPKYVVIILDNDLVEAFNPGNVNVCEQIGPWVEWLADEIHDAFKKRKTQMDEKTYDEGNPFIYWVAAPTHRDFSPTHNALREQFNNCLISVMKLHPDMRVIHLKTWNKFNSELVAGNKFSVGGLYQYWEAIDASLKFNIKKRRTFELRSALTKIEQEQTAEKQKTYVGKKDDMMSFFRRHKNKVGTKRHCGPQFILPKIKHRKK